MGKAFGRETDQRPGAKASGDLFQCNLRGDVQGAHHLACQLGAVQGVEMQILDPALQKPVAQGGAMGQGKQLFPPIAGCGAEGLVQFGGTCR